jgi:DNA sulfur modification protein DndC
VLGVRRKESEERKRVLTRHSTKIKFYYKQSSVQGRKLFCPIVDLDTVSVWEGLFSIPRPSAIDVHNLAQLYKQASGECPIVREVNGSPCGQGRFGCWTCTVVRRDRAVEGLISEGHTHLRPLLDFRDWLIRIRENVEYRCTVRRNGAPGLGPFRLSARKELLRRLLTAQRQSGLRLIREAEIRKIQWLWASDLESPSYVEDMSFAMGSRKALLNYKG